MLHPVPLFVLLCVLAVAGAAAADLSEIGKQIASLLRRPRRWHAFDHRAKPRPAGEVRPLSRRGMRLRDTRPFVETDLRDLGS